MKVFEFRNRKRKVMLRSTIVTLLILSVLAFAIVSDSYARISKGTSRLELVLGAWVPVSSEVSVGIDGVNTSTGVAGLNGGFAYSNFFQKNMAVTIALSGLAVDVETSVGSQGVVSRTAVVASILPGIRYYFLESSLKNTTRPYLSISFGPYIGTESESSVGTTVVAKSESFAAFGARLGAGIDFELSRRFMLGMLAGYNLMTDFSEPVGSRVNYSGPDLGISFSLLLGGSR